MWGSNPLLILWKRRAGEFRREVAANALHDDCSGCPDVASIDANLQSGFVDSSGLLVTVWPQSK
ncbi:MAG: hypothetical protein ABSG53_03555 [Thermoguttaceae bacterium]|jgi:hypothetical protein